MFIAILLTIAKIKNQSRWLDKENMVYACHREWIPAICRKMNGTKVHHVMWNKSDTNKYWIFFFRCGNLKKKSNFKVEQQLLGTGKVPRGRIEGRRKVNGHEQCMIICVHGNVTLNLINLYNKLIITIIIVLKNWNGRNSGKLWGQNYLIPKPDKGCKKNPPISPWA
jgi:hypothetical protein